MAAIGPARKKTVVYLAFNISRSRADRDWSVAYSTQTGLPSGSFEINDLVELAKLILRPIPPPTSADEIIAASRSITSVLKMLTNRVSLAWSVYVMTHDVSYSTTFNMNGLTSELNIKKLGFAIRDLDALAQKESTKIDPSEKSISARKAIEGLNDFSSNLLAYASDIRETGSTIRSLLSLVADPTNPRLWASAWLSGHYGDQLTVKDTHELISALGHALTSGMTYGTGRDRIIKTRHSENQYGKFDFTVERLAVIIASNESYDALATTINNLMRWDAWPTLENTWDLIPMSFVVDWFLPVSDLLSQMDAAVQAPYIRPLSQYCGLASTVSNTDLSSYGMSGRLSVRRYQRMPSSILDDVRPFDVVASPPSFSVVHMTDALAMLVQTSKWHS
jgi:hypothetical protein